MVLIVMFVTVLSFASVGPPSIAASEIGITTEMQFGQVTISTAVSRIDYLTSVSTKATEMLTTETIQAQATSATNITIAGVDEVAGYTLTTIKPDLTNYSPKKGLMVADEKTIIYKGAVFRNVCLLEVRLI